MPTELIKQLHIAPVKFLQKIAITDRLKPITRLEQESKIVEKSYNEAEQVTVTAIFSARFLQYPNDSKEERNEKHMKLLQTLVDGVYGEIRIEIRKLHRTIYDLPIAKPKLDKIEQQLNHILELMELR